jgi:hypothetical protein
MPYSVRLSVEGLSVPLGIALDQEALVGILRHVADYYERHPDACERLFPRSDIVCVPMGVAQPFSDGLAAPTH